MRKSLYLLFLNICVLSMLAEAQHSYIIEIDRLKNSFTYKEVEFINGRPEEKPIRLPMISKGDIIKIRFINFNELIYGLDVKQKLVKSPSTNVVTKFLNANPLIGYLKSSPAMEIINMILKGPAPPVSRGKKDAPSIYSIAADYKKTREQITAADEMSRIIYDEGATLEEIKEKINRLYSEYEPNKVELQLKKIQSDIAILTGYDDRKVLGEISDEVNEFLALQESDYLPSGINLKKIRKVLANVDFKTERTIIVGEKIENIDETTIDYEKFIVYLLIYKRARPITDPARLTNAVYSYERDGISENDVIHQSIVVNLKLKNPKKIYWSVGVNKIFGSKNMTAYDIIKNYNQDSVIFKNKKIAGSGIMVSSDINYNLPYINDLFRLTFAVGIGIAIDGKQKSGSVSGLSTSQAYLTTGLSAISAKFPYLSLKTGICWSKFSQLSKPYEVEKWYPNTISNPNLDQAITKRWKPFLYAGINVNL